MFSKLKSPNTKLLAVGLGLVPLSQGPGTDVRKLSNTVHLSPIRSIACFNKLDVLPPLHVIIWKHLLHFAMSESLAVK